MDRGQIVELAVKAVREYDEKHRKSRQDRRLRNTRLLLKNYILLQEHCRKAVYDKTDTVENAIDVFDAIEDLDRTTYVLAIKKSVARTQIILTHIEEMMKIYKILCDVSSKPEDQRRYRVAMNTFFQKTDIKAICEQENIDKSTYYRDIRESCEKLSALFFGVDGLLDVQK